METETLVDVSPEIKFSKDGKLYIDCTCGGDFQSCHRYAKYRYQDCLSPVEARMALRYGSCFHDALYEWNASGDFARTIRVFTTSCDKYEIPTTDDKRSKTNGAAILLHYDKQNSADRKLDTRIAGEVGFCLPHPFAQGVMIVGKIDYIFTRNGNLRIRDHKTASQIGTAYKFNINPNLAAGIYTWAVETVFEKKVEMFDFDVILVAKEKRENVRYPIMRSQWKIDSALEDMRIIAGDIKNKIQSQEWDRNTKHCSSYGGCQFHDLCCTENNGPLVDSMFTKEVWRPYHAD